MRGLQFVDVPPGIEGAGALQAALRQRFLDDGAAVVPLPTVSRHVTTAYVDSVRRALSTLPAEVPDDVAAVLPTSGSTGRPRGVLLTRANLEQSAALADLARPGLAQCSWILALPATSIGGLNVIARSLLSGTDLTALPSIGGALPFDPADLIGLIASGPMAVSLVPGQLRAILDNDDATRWLAAAHTVLVGGAAAPEDVMSRARAVGIAAVSTYGMTETTGGCVFDGIPFPGVTTGVRDDGRISISGPVVAAGYADPEPTDGFAVEDGDHRFLTSDVGAWDGERLTVLGRADDIVTVHGVNVALGEIERILRAVADVHEAAVVALPDATSGHRLVAYVALDGEQSATSTDLANLVRTQLGGAARPEVIVLDALPHLPNGKIDRLALRSAREPGKG